MKNISKESAAERLYTWLIVLFTTGLIISNIASTKIVGFGALVFDAGTILFPITYIIGDIMTELFGFKRMRRAIWVGFITALITMMIFTLVQYLPSDPSWHGQSSYETILGVVPRIAIASFIAFLIGELLNAYVLAELKVRLKGKRLWSRMIGSSVIGNAVDTTIFSVIAFYGTMPDDVLVALILTVYGMKMATEIILSPLTMRLINTMKSRYKLDTYEKPQLFD